PVFRDKIAANQEEQRLDQKAYRHTKFPDEHPRRSRAAVAKWPYDPLDGPEHYRVDARHDGRLPEPGDDTELVRRSHPRRVILDQAAERVRVATGVRENLEQDLAQRVDWVLSRAQVAVQSDIHRPEHLAT